jgi:hypothetical protein
MTGSDYYLGKRVQVTAGACAGRVGVIKGAKTLPGRADAMTGEFRVEFSPPIHLPTAGYLNAVWRRPTEFIVFRAVGSE